MRGIVHDQSDVELDEMDKYKGNVFAISNAAFDYTEEKKEYRNFSQQFSRKCRNSAHMWLTV